MQVYTKTLLACVLALAAANFSVAQEDDTYAKEYNTKPETDFHNIFRRDESALYVELLAIKLRKLDDRLQRIAMHKIDTIMFDLISDSSQSPNSVIFKVIQSDMPSLRFFLLIKPHSCGLMLQPQLRHFQLLLNL
ncbi:uncharacterized protein LOC115879287 isoform X2 [Sitophilus oryzae]|uniref:Uncharacterized protein LOC115879287 isoform X2 n=1 Tax=Sitophilus oryzae TaxID=7048 RepID=A0A6J2XLD5_SITOR|nr:uncharacterized protein LOC115879287 isoform X2 [Sitophilus oryzae]